MVDINKLLSAASRLKAIASRVATHVGRAGEIVTADTAAELGAINAELDAEIAVLEPLAHAKLRGDAG